MKFPISTGPAAKLLETTEPHLAEKVRRGKIRPEPPIVAGRRLWEREHLIQAAQELGVLTDDLRRRLDEEVAHPREGEQERHSMDR